jgi:1,4-dihydroxy-2-naphthoate octaprenyltransferase
MQSRAYALWLTARPKTLAASAVPVMVGTALAYASGSSAHSWLISACALLAAMMIQIGTNFINDALDFAKGADGETRLGEARATQQGWFSKRTVLRLGLAWFALAMVFGFPLVWYGGWPILAIGLVSLVMGYAYTGGPFPLAYVGLGDLFVVIFFGLVAVGGVFYLQTGTYSWSGVIAGLQVGLLATVLIAINNLRDLDQDRLVHKKTLAVRLGPKLGRLEVLLLNLTAFALGGYWLTFGKPMAFVLPLIALPNAILVVAQVLRTAASRQYNQLLARAAMVHMLFGLLLAAGLFWP